jgi:hypothetical protein
VRILEVSVLTFARQAFAKQPDYKPKHKIRPGCALARQAGLHVLMDHAQLEEIYA